MNFQVPVRRGMLFISVDSNTLTRTEKRSDDVQENGLGTLGKNINSAQMNREMVHTRARVKMRKVRVSNFNSS